MYPIFYVPQKLQFIAGELGFQIFHICSRHYYYYYQ